MSKRPKRLLALLLIALLLLGVTGCGGGESGGTDGAEDIRLLVWAPSEDQRRVAPDLLQQLCGPAPRVEHHL